MTLTSIKQIPKGAVKDGHTEEVFTPGLGCYFIRVYTRGVRRYYELSGLYAGRACFSTSIQDDRETAIRQIKNIANMRVGVYKKIQKAEQATGKIKDFILNQACSWIKDLPHLPPGWVYDFTFGEPRFNPETNAWEVTMDAKPRQLNITKEDNYEIH